MIRKIKQWISVFLAGLAAGLVIAFKILANKKEAPKPEIVIKKLKVRGKDNQVKDITVNTK